MCIHRAAGPRDWLFKKETSCLHKSLWTLRGLRGYRVGEGVSLWWYGSLMGTADNTHYPSPSIPSILQPPVLWATGRNRRRRQTGRETWAVQLSHLVIFEAILLSPHFSGELSHWESLCVRTQSSIIPTQMFILVKYGKTSVWGTTMDSETDKLITISGRHALHSRHSSLLRKCDILFGKAHERS